MKRWLILGLLLLWWIQPVMANERKTVTLAKCTDGDTAHFIIDGSDTTVRFLAVDTPEYTKEKEPYGKEASEYTCSALKQAKRIELEYDDGSDLNDKYGRQLAWVFVDGELLQRQLVEQGLAEVKYIYGDYAYTEQLYQVQEQAKRQQLHIWSEETEGIGFDVVTLVITILGGLLIAWLSVSQVKGKRRKIQTVKKVMKQVKRR